MRCVKCKKELDSKTKFCPHCGAKQNAEKKDASQVVWTVFAGVGLGLSITGLAFCWSIVGMVFAIHGIVLSALGRKSTEKSSMATVGLVLSIIATALSALISFIFISRFF